MIRQDFAHICAENDVYNQQVGLKLTDSQIYWLTKVKKLSKTLNECFDGWGITLHYVGQLESSRAENNIINIFDNSLCYGRIITHDVDKQPIVIGKVVMSIATYNCYKNELDEIENNSIGEYFLFNNKFKRSCFSIKQYFRHEIMSINNLPKEIYPYIPEIVLARSSIFTIDKDKIMVTEYFLKNLVPPLAK